MTAVRVSPSVVRGLKWSHRTPTSFSNICGWRLFMFVVLPASAMRVRFADCFRRSEDGANIVLSVTKHQLLIDGTLFFWAISVKNVNIMAYGET